IFAVIISYSLLMSACGASGAGNTGRKSSSSKTHAASVTKSEGDSSSGDVSGSSASASNSENGVKSGSGVKGSGSASSTSTSTSSTSTSDSIEPYDYTLEYELLYYWFDDEEGRWVYYPNGTATRNGELVFENQGWCDRPYAYCMVNVDAKGRSWCNLYLNFLAGVDGEMYISESYDQINGTFYDNDLNIYSGIGGGGEGSMFAGGDFPPYAIEGCGTDSMTVASVYEYGRHITYVLKLIRDTRNN
nr:hypothetical protein [Lachnospiraceae bacterium]